MMGDKLTSSNGLTIAIVLVMLMMATKNMDILNKKRLTIAQPPHREEIAKSMGSRLLKREIIVGMVKKDVQMSTEPMAR